MNKPLKNILAAIGNTPVFKINKLAPSGINLYVKAEGFNPMSSVKDRMGLSTIEAAEASATTAAKSASLLVIWCDGKGRGVWRAERQGGNVWVVTK